MTEMSNLTCQCGATTLATTLADTEAVPGCTGCATCHTTLRRQAPWPWREAHQPGPRDRDEPGSPVACRQCGLADPAQADPAQNDAGQEQAA